MPGSSKIIRGPFKWVIVTPYGLCYGCRRKPRKIPGGYITSNGRRFISDPRRPFNDMRLFKNDQRAVVQ